MERLTYITSAVTGLQEQMQGALEVARKHPWVAAGVVAGTAYLSGYLMAPRNLPPGPMNLPLIGAVSCRNDGLEQKMVTWRKQYGDVVSYYKFGRLFVMLNSERVIREAFLKKGEEFAHRSTLGPFSPGVFGTLDDIFSAKYDEQWKKNKKFAVVTLKNFGLGTAKSEEKLNTCLQFMLDGLAKSKGAPIDLLDECKILTSGVMSSILFSGDIAWADPQSMAIIDWVNKWYEHLAKYYYASMRVSNFLPEIPLLTPLLVLKSHNKLKTTHTQFIDYIAGLMKSHRDGLAEREAEDVAEAYMKERGVDDAIIRRIASTIIMFLPDAIHSAASIDMWALLYATLNLDAQRKVQDEVDEVLGKRLPTLSDRANMPYTQAFMHEVLRLTLIMPSSGLRYINKEGVTLCGYNIPKGTQVIANYHSVNFDQELFPDPMKFDLSRFITSDGKFNSSLGGRIMSFSLGPRMCMGDLYYKVHFFFFITRMLQRFNIEYDPSKPKPTLESDTSSLVAKPLGFKVCLTER